MYAALGFAHAHINALNRVFTGIDIWILFKIFVIMPVTGVFFWWQVRVLHKYRLPEPIADRLQHGEKVIADRFEDVTMLFADIVDFTVMSSRMTAVEVVDVLNQVAVDLEIAGDLGIGLRVDEPERAPVVTQERDVGHEQREVRGEARDGQGDAAALAPAIGGDP